MSRLPSRLALLPMLGGSLARGLFAGRGPSAAPRRILVAHHLLLGDTLMLAALLAKLRRNHPQAEIVMACPTAILPLFAARPWGVQAVAYDPRRLDTLRALRHLARAGSKANKGFDLALLPADNRLSWLARALGARHIVAFAGDRPPYKNWFVDELRPWPATPTALPETFATLADGSTPDAFTQSDWPLAECRPFTLPAGDYAVLHLGASSPLKLWPAERWAELAAWLDANGITPVWSAGAKETALAQAADPARRFPSFAGQLDLLQMAHLLRGARLLVCPDTGIAHLGRVVATPTVTLFGPGSALLCGSGPFFQQVPYRAVSIDIACRNQHTLFKREIDWVQRCGRRPGVMPSGCPRGQCMEGLGLQAVQAACAQLLPLHLPNGTRLDPA